MTCLPQFRQMNEGICKRICALFRVIRTVAQDQGPRPLRSAADKYPAAAHFRHGKQCVPACKSFFTVRVKRDINQFLRCQMYPIYLRQCIQKCQDHRCTAAESADRQ